MEQPQAHPQSTHYLQSEVITRGCVARAVTGAAMNHRIILTDRVEDMVVTEVLTLQAKFQIVAPEVLENIASDLAQAAAIEFKAARSGTPDDWEVMERVRAVVKGQAETVGNAIARTQLCRAAQCLEG
jgi:hypothetical protein